jgi:hypothetical protein
MTYRIQEFGTPGTIQPSWLTFTENSRTFSSGALTTSESGRYEIVMATSNKDSNGIKIETVLGGFLLRINYTPQCDAAVGAPSGKEGHVYSYTVPTGSFKDTDDKLFSVPTEAFTYKVFMVALDLTGRSSDATSWLTFNAGTRVLSGTPAVGDAATVTYKACVYDNKLASVCCNFDIVVAANSPVVVSNEISRINI